MPDTVSLEMLDADGLPRTARPRATQALVWAADARRAAEAVEHLRHGLWPYWFLFEITDVRQLPLGMPCPISGDHPDVLASASRERWMWVLVAPGIDPEAVPPCM